MLKIKPRFIYMYSILVTTHSVLRWILLISLVLTLIYAAFNRAGKQPFNNSIKNLSATTVRLLHLQLLVGIILYFISPKVIFSGMAMKAHLSRFFLVEHLTGMLIAVILITIGYSKAKKMISDQKKYNTILIYYTIGFLAIMAAIPWPFYNLGAGWI
jgi:hypothetical protein